MKRTGKYGKRDVEGRIVYYRRDTKLRCEGPRCRRKACYRGWSYILHGTRGPKGWDTLPKTYANLCERHFMEGSEGIVAIDCPACLKRAKKRGSHIAPDSPTLVNGTHYYATMEQSYRRSGSKELWAVMRYDIKCWRCGKVLRPKGPGRGWTPVKAPKEGTRALRT